MLNGLNLRFLRKSETLRDSERLSETLRLHLKGFHRMKVLIKPSGVFNLKTCEAHQHNIAKFCADGTASLSCRLYAWQACEEACMLHREDSRMAGKRASESEVELSCCVSLLGSDRLKAALALAFVP